ncbi:hypothetical protein ACVIRM_004742, partial [Rhizobium laguerreae]
MKDPDYRILDACLDSLLERKKPARGGLLSMCMLEFG